MPTLFRSVFGLLLLVLAGCGSSNRSEPIVRLQGNVTVNGQPLPADAVGSVIFMPRVPGQAPATEARIEGGHYQTDNAPRGDITALFHINRATGKMIKDTPNDEHPHPEQENLVPEKLRAGIRTNVTGDNPHQDFDLRN